jgi:hypothetical protein
VQDELHGWKSLSWGVTDWVLRRGRIMGFGDVIVSSNTDYANSQAIYLLGNRYIRFAPNTTYGLIDYYINVFTGRPGRVVRDAPEVAMQWFYSDSGQVDSCSANDVLNHLANYGWISPAA